MKLILLVNAFGEQTKQETSGKLVETFNDFKRI